MLRAELFLARSSFVDKSNIRCSVERIVGGRPRFAPHLIPSYCCAMSIMKHESDIRLKIIHYSAASTSFSFFRVFLTLQIMLSHGTCMCFGFGPIT